MTTTTEAQPLTKWQARVRNDLRGQARYTKRTSIDKRLEDMRFARQMRSMEL